ncbi:MAG: hydantoinase B/oxoprolinase family protein, partial [Pirellulales bacterium]
MPIVPWEFWIDVGGTFCDVIARRPDQSLVRHKLLSSAVTKGTAEEGSGRRHVVDRSRRHDPPHFWNGYRLVVFDARGAVAGETRVDHFDSATGLLRFDRLLDEPVIAGQSYELCGDDEAPVLAIRYLMELARDAPIPPIDVRLGTTRGTNTLLTRSGPETAFVTTRGFGDILEIGDQDRPDLFRLAIRKRRPLATRAIEIDERIDATGNVLEAPDRGRVLTQLQKLRGQGFASLAICLMHGYVYPQHERMVADIACQVGFDEISLSNQVAPLMKLVARGDTTTLNAYLNPVLRTYIGRLKHSLGFDVRETDPSRAGTAEPTVTGSGEGELGDRSTGKARLGRLRILTSAGGLVEAARFSGSESILSGPAGGAVGFARVAQAAQFSRAIGFDMGGTSTDVSRFDGRFVPRYETVKGGVRVVAPTLPIETVAAGGGSICRFDGVKLAVGPDSAGADPGPACYGRGGPLTVTDLNVVLGRIPGDCFPFRLDVTAARARLAEVVTRIERENGRCYDQAELAAGYLRVANTNMVGAIRSISLAEGVDPRDYLLVAFGGAAPQHACAVARELGVTRILVHPDAGVLSALGIGLADVVRHRVAALYQVYDPALLTTLESLFRRLSDEVTAEVQAEGVPESRIDLRRSLDLRYAGLDAYLTVDQPDDDDYVSAYHAEHRRRYGYADLDRPVEAVAVRVEATGRSPQTLPTAERCRCRRPSPPMRNRVYLDGNWHEAPLFARSRLQPGDVVDGPAVIDDAVATTLVEKEWRAEVLSGKELLLTAGAHDAIERMSTDADPIMLEVFNNQFSSIAQQMGITLRNTATSVNVKERLDFSCAIFTASGDLVVNAPHIPVHLGAMAETVRSLLEHCPTMAEGDVFVTNDPYRGGSHLPDITVITPIHDPRSGRRLFFTASRAHHAEIGGIRPGSMPPNSRTLAEEGVLLRHLKLVDRGRSRESVLREALLSAEFPTRRVDDNLADIRAQVAANRQGALHLEELVDRYSLPVVEAYMVHIQAAAQRKTEIALARLGEGVYEFVDHLDDGTPLAVALSVCREQVTIDFTGTGQVHTGNFNANRAIVTAAVMYVMRLLIDEPIPLNQGVLNPVRIVLPEGLLNPPEGPTPGTTPAVVGGNVETSQRVVDVLLGALQLAAASQGTMNNLLFGDETFGYYETICGGAGATRGAGGADCVHTHMTNTRLTDPEVLERRFPVRVRRFTIRRGSAGAGAWRGGDGVVRELEFLRQMEVSLLSQRRGPYPPYGL